MAADETAPECIPPLTLRDRLEALPEQGATSGRDFGRGYSQAIRDVLQLIEWHDPSYLAEQCECEPRREGMMSS